MAERGCTKVICGSPLILASTLELKVPPICRHIDRFLTLM